MATSSSVCRSLHSKLHWRQFVAPVKLVTGRRLGLSPAEARLSAQCLPSNNTAATQSSLVTRLSTQCLSDTSASSYTSQLRLTSPSVTPASDLSKLLNFLSISDNAISLPALVPLPPAATPPPTPAAPQHLPGGDTVAPAIVEPYTDLLPRLLPEHSSQTHLTKQCENMVRQRSKAMKKHQRMKEMKRNRVSHEQRIVRNINLREKLFMAEQMSILREAEAFDAEKHVKDILARVNHRPVPKFWRGKRLHEPVVIELMHKAGLKIPGIDDK